MRTSLGMSKKRADLVCRFRRQVVLELASLLLDFCLAVHRERIRKKTFGQSVAANDVRRPLPPSRRQLDNRATITHGNAVRFQRFMTRVDEGLVAVGQRR